MNVTIASQVFLIIAILTTGIIYGTDMFHALVVKKAASLSQDNSITDLIGRTHLIADKRMPVIGITSLATTVICLILNFENTFTAALLGAALFMLLSHLYLYITIAKPVNKEISDAAVKNITPGNIRALQIRWDSVICYRAGFLTAAMLLLAACAVFCK